MICYNQSITIICKRREMKMDDNTAPNMGGGLQPNNTGPQATGQSSQSNSFSSPTPQSPQITPQQAFQPNTVPTSMPGANTAPASNNKKKILIICGIVSAVALVALIIVLLVIFLGGGKKTVSCSQHESMLGIEIDGETNVEVVDGKILGGDIKLTANLKTLDARYAEYEEEMVDSVVERLERNCETDCESNRDYVKGDHLEVTLKYGPEGVDDLVYTYGIEDKSAQEIADKIQESLEKTEGTTCKQH